MTCFACSPSATNPMNIVLWNIWQIKIHDMRELLNLSLIHI